MRLISVWKIQILITMFLRRFWHSIRANCLPIYRGSGQRIYEDFPKSSFIDYEDFGNSQALLDYINKMTKSEYCYRMNKCIGTYNAIFEKYDFQKKREEMMMLIVTRIKEITSGQNPASAI